MHDIYLNFAVCSTCLVKTPEDKFEKVIIKVKNDIVPKKTD